MFFTLYKHDLPPEVEHVGGGDAVPEGVMRSVKFIFLVRAQA